MIHPRAIVHERLQLNEDTLWAGRPYDPVNPDAKDALPEVRRLIADRKYPDAAKLVGAKVMSKPLAQMPYQTVGDLALTFPQVESVENYRRDLDLATATAHVSYVRGGVTFSREVFASAPDQVIVVRLTADWSASISFPAPVSGGGIELVTTAQSHVRCLTQRPLSGLNITKYR